MSIQTQILFWTILGWLLFPILGVVDGTLVGLLYRKGNVRIDTNSKQPTSVAIGAGIAFGLVIIGYIVSYVVFPQYWIGINVEDFSIQTAVTFLFYAIIAEFVTIQIANGKKKEA